MPNDSCPRLRQARPGPPAEGQGRRHPRVMFDDLEPADRALVEVDGWPDFAAIERNRAESSEVS